MHFQTCEWQNNLLLFYTISRDLVFHFFRLKLAEIRQKIVLREQRLEKDLQAKMEKKYADLEKRLHEKKLELQAKHHKQILEVSFVTNSVRFRIFQ